MALEQLRKLRNKQNKRRRKARNINENNGGKRKEGSSIGGGSIIRNIHFIFTRATRKWRDDVSLYLQHAEYAKKTKSFRMLGKIYADALQVHPKNSALWIEAASHEFFGFLDSDDGVYGGSIKNARVLMQRGIRVNPTSKQLYLQYFSLEWHYAQKIRGRREILQITDTEKDDPDDNTNEAISDGSNSGLYTGAVPLVIYKMAIKQIPKDVEFRLDFLSLCHLFPQTENVKKEILQSIEDDFSNLPDAWIARATYVPNNTKHWKNKTVDGTIGFYKSDNGSEIEHDHDDGNAEEKIASILEILDKALEKISTEEMHMKCIAFIQADSSILDSQIGNQYYGQLFERAKSAKVLSPQLLLQWTTYLIQSDNIIKAEKILRKATVAADNGKDSILFVPLWLQYADLIQKLDTVGLLTQFKKEYENESKSNQLPSKALDVLRMASDVIPIHDSSHMTVLLALFNHLLTNFASKSGYEKEISSIFIRILLLTRNDHSVADTDLQHEDMIPDVCLKYLQHESISGGLSAARAVYETVLFHSNFSAYFANNAGNKMPAFFNACISLEKNSPENRKNFKYSQHSTKKRVKLEKGKQGRHRLMRIYDSIIDFYKKGDNITAMNEYRQKKFDDITFM